MEDSRGIPCIPKIKQFNVEEIMRKVFIYDAVCERYAFCLYWLAILFDRHKVNTVMKGPCGQTRE